MRPQPLLLLALSALILVVALLVRHYGKNEPERPLAGQPKGGGELDPSLAILLRERAKDDSAHASRFLSTLSALIDKQGLDPNAWLGFVEEGYAVKVGASHDRHVVVVLRGWSHTIPGSDTQHLVLLGDDGRLLDRLSCEINARLTRMYVDHSGTFRTDVEGAADGAQLVVRYIPAKGETLSGNWDHVIRHAGKAYRFHWDQERPEAIRSAQWERQGLCRVAVRDGKFAVVFPNLGERAR